MNASEYFVTQTRDDGTTFVTLRPDRPEWLQDAVYDAHDGELPNDWRYSMCESIVEMLAEYDDVTLADDRPAEIADSLCDIYNYDLVRWLADDISRSAYCDDFSEQYSVNDDGNDIWNMIRSGQWLAISNMVATIMEAITENVSDES